MRCATMSSPERPDFQLAGWHWVFKDDWKMYSVCKLSATYELICGILACSTWYLILWICIDCFDMNQWINVEWVCLMLNISMKIGKIHRRICKHCDSVPGDLTSGSVVDFYPRSRCNAPALFGSAVWWCNEMRELWGRVRKFCWENDPPMPPCGIAIECTKNLIPLGLWKV